MKLWAVGILCCTLAGEACNQRPVKSAVPSILLPSIGFTFRNFDAGAVSQRLNDTVVCVLKLV